MNPLNNGSAVGSSLSPQLRQNINAIKGIMNQVKAINSPNVALQQFSQSNPMVNQVMQMCKGKDPKDVFMSMCKQRGIDPQAILDELQN